MILHKLRQLITMQLLSKSIELREYALYIYANYPEDSVYYSYGKLFEDYSEVFINMAEAFDPTLQTFTK